MSAMSDYLEAELLDHCFNAAFTSPAGNTFISLYTTAVGDDDSGTEVTGGSYAREEVDVNGGVSPTWDLAVVDGIGYLVDNTHDIVFTTATADWGVVSNFGIHDAVTVGNLLFHGALDASKTVNNGDTFKFLAGDLNIRME